MISYPTLEPVQRCYHLATAPVTFCNETEGGKLIRLVETLSAFLLLRLYARSCLCSAENCSCGTMADAGRAEGVSEKADGFGSPQARPVFGYT